MTDTTVRWLVVAAGLLLSVPIAGVTTAYSSADSSSTARCDHSKHVHPSPEHKACLGARSLSGSSDSGSGSDEAEKDVMDLTDFPGNWFRSQRNGTPVSFVRVGGEVQFVAGDLTNTRHTATLVSRPPGRR